MEENTLQKAILVGVSIKGNNKDFDYQMKELENLAQACEFEVVGIMEQSLSDIVSATYIGSGKVEELKEVAENLEADVIIFNSELTPSQLTNLANLTQVSIYDRTYLILEIFAKRAKTKEAKLQVESARLSYLLPRLTGMGINMSRQGGGSGLHNRGSGEKKLELNRRKINKRISEIEDELKKIEEVFLNQRKMREKSKLPLVALVGYTNAGKSTILNSMLEKYREGEEDKKVFEKDMLFATLETKVRHITNENNKTFLLSDTVGFVSNLPHHLVKAFRSTLKEAQYADLILNVVDYSDDESETHRSITLETLEKIGVKNIPIITVYNKIDKTELKKCVSNGDKIYISAKSKEGIELLSDTIVKNVFSDYIDCKLLIPFERGDIVSKIISDETVLQTDYTENGTLLLVSLSQEGLNRYKEYIKE